MIEGAGQPKSNQTEMIAWRGGFAATSTNNDEGGIGGQEGEETLSTDSAYYYHQEEQQHTTTTNISTAAAASQVLVTSRMWGSITQNTKNHHVPDCIECYIYGHFYI